MIPRPPSATPVLTGAIGIAAICIALVVLRDISVPLHAKALTIVLTAAAAMIAIEVVFFKTWRNPLADISPVALNPLSWERIVRKLTGLLATLSVIAIAYWLFPVYRREFFEPFWSVLELCLPFIVLAAPFYIALVDRRQKTPEDAYAAIGGFILHGAAPADWRQIRQHALGWIVKAFFLPLMFVYLCGSLNSLLTTLAGTGIDALGWHRLGINFLYLLDVVFAVVGYSFTLRLLDTHIRSVEPTALGWLVCILCYEPFSNVMSAYFARDIGDNWIPLLAAWPSFQLLWSSAILLCIVIYAWSTACFGLRFSNLTHRGIITSGPYRWVKHPAYLSKNLSWWLISLPFFSTAGYDEGLRQSLMLLCINGIYLLRAVTEERHLSRDPDYRAYQDFIRRDGLWARLKRLAGQRTADMPAKPEAEPAYPGRWHTASILLPSGSRTKAP